VTAKQVSFSFAARTIDFFGGQSISEDSAAIFELVKNSRDANAKTVEIKFNNITSSLNSEIIIYDDGDGMSEDDIMKKWMVLGTNNRALNNKTKRGKEVWGEKGIGRMACQKLSNETNLISVKNKERVVMDFNWKKFEDTTASVDQILFDLNSKPTNEENGVTLTLNNLKSKWTSKRITELKMELSRLVSKEILLEDTQIKIKSGDEEGEIIGKTYSKLLQSITDHSPFKLNAIFSNGELKIKVMNQIDGKKIWQKNVLANSRFMSDSETGPFTVDLFYFPRAPGKEKTDTIEKYYDRTIKPGGRDSVTDFLHSTFGIYLYRGGAWMKPYGGSTDWLGMASNSVNRTNDIRLPQIYGVINLTKKGNPQIKTTSHRESITTNDAFLHLQKIMKMILREFSDFYIDWKKNRTKDKLKDSGAVDGTTVTQGIEDMAKNALKITRGLLPTKESAQLKQIMGGITLLHQNDSENKQHEISEMGEMRHYEKNLATIGIASSVMAQLIAVPLEANMDLLKEGEKMKTVIEKEGRALNSTEIKRSDEIISQMGDNQNKILHFMKYVNTLSEHISKSISGSKNFTQVNVKQCWDTVSYGFDSHESKLDIQRFYAWDVPKPFTGVETEELVVKFNKIDLECILTNFHLNSITSLSLSSNLKKEITFHYWHSNNSLYLEFLDNGIGIPEEKLDEIFEPFKFGTNRDSKSNVQHGRGLGLHIVKEIVKSYNGEVKAVKSATGAKIQLSIPDIKRVS